MVKYLLKTHVSTSAPRTIRMLSSNDDFNVDYDVCMRDYDLSCAETIKTMST